MPKSIMEVANGFRDTRRAAKAREIESVEKHGGHVEWLRRRAPELLPLYPAGPTREQFLAESLDGWEDAAARLRQCAVCPEHGGACDNSQNAWPDGHAMVPDAEKGIRAEACPKWATFLTWRMLEAANVPLPCRSPRPVSSLPGYAAVIAPALREAHRTRMPTWYFVTGGDARSHRTALIPLVVELGAVIYKKNFWYDWSLRIARALRTHMNDPDSLDIRNKLLTVPVLAVDHVNPTKWEPWFCDAMDDILYSRSGLTTVVASSRTVAELAEVLPLTASLLEGAVQVVLE